MIGRGDALVVDARQLVRIEAVHRGFLYQHLYAVACLLLATKGGATEIVVEHDEDVEIVLPEGRIYVQVKTRSEPLAFRDIEGAMLRFAAVRAEYEAGRRTGKPLFVIAANVPPGPKLAARLSEDAWPRDVALHWPEGPDVGNGPMPKAWDSTSDAFAACCTLAGSLPFAMLAPETLVWKLAGRVMSAATGAGPHADHTFKSGDLPELFEQLVVQLQDFPAPPACYRPQDQEPPLVSDQRVRLITGYSGAGKTSWVAHAVVHTTDVVAYFNVSDVPSTALVITVAREMAARFFGKGSGKLGEILLPGASGSQVLFAIGQRLAKSGTPATVVIDNAHLISDGDMRNLIEASEHFRFVLLAQPGVAVQIIEARLGMKAEPLLGWTNETIAAEGAALGCHGDYAAYGRLLELTGGLPLYVQNALQVTAEGYGGAVSRFCAELEEQTHARATAQELIVSRVFEGYGVGERQAIGALSLIDVPLSQQEAVQVLQAAVNFDGRAVAALFRKLRETGALHMFGTDQVKVHDAMRLLGRAHLETLGADVLQKARQAIEAWLIVGVKREWTPQRVSLLLRMFVALDKVKPLVELATDEFFHEMGYMTEIAAYLESITLTSG